MGTLRLLLRRVAVSIAAVFLTACATTPAGGSTHDPEWIYDPIRHIEIGMSPDAVSALLDEHVDRLTAPDPPRPPKSRMALCHAFTVQSGGATVMGFRSPALGYYFIFEDGALRKLADAPPLVTTMRVFGDGQPHKFSGPHPVREIAAFVQSAPGVEPSDLYADRVNRHRRALENPPPTSHGEFNPIFLVVLPLMPLMALTNPSYEQVLQEFAAKLHRYSAQQFLPGTSLGVVNAAWGPPISQHRASDGTVVTVYGDPALGSPRLRIEVESTEGTVRAIYSNYDSYDPPSNERCS